jgi:RimJ/RimL family protein N-acetyltransferase/Flp pilus assembly protein TadD
VQQSDERHFPIEAVLNNACPSESQMPCLQVNQRIELRLINRCHAAELFALIECNREYLRRWHPWVDHLHSANDAEKMISAWQQQHERNRGFCAGIWFDEKLCGTINHVNVDWSNRSAALSYWLDAAHQGQGIMTTCCRAMVAHGFKAWKLNRITVECATDNVRSRAIPERLGFKLEGIIRGAEWLHDHHADHAIYGLLHSDSQSAPDLSVKPKPDDSWKPETPIEQDSRLTNSFERSLKLGFEMHNAGRTQEAEAMCRVLMQIQPQNTQLLFLLGMILHKGGQETEAVKWLSLAAEGEPHSARIFHGLGCAHQNLGDHSRAVDAFDQALRLEPHSGALCYSLGNSYYRLEQIDRAVTLFQQAVKINPRDSASWNNLGKCLNELNRPDESIEAYNRSVEITPDYALARYGRAISLLTAGRLPEGFKEYEWRLNLTKQRELSQPTWHGESAPGKTLLLQAEQGFGDAIQMVRFIAKARERVGRVILECRPDLTTLFKYSKCADVVVPYGSIIPPFDCFLRLLSLPHALGVTIDAIPNQVPYLGAPAWARPLPALRGHLKVGLAWAGNPHHHQDAARSIRLQELAPVLQVPDVTFYSLQKPVPAQDETYLRSVSDLIDSSLTFGDFLETASVIAGLDLVITVDTAVAHLAGALGKPVWLLVQHSPDWRWFLDRADTPWYPTMRLYRQAKRNCWELPVKRVAAALQDWSDSASVAVENPSLRNYEPGNAVKIDARWTAAHSWSAQYQPV